MNMLTPIIMENSTEKVVEKLELLRSRNEKRVHFDIGDGMFSEWLGVTPLDLAELDVSDMEVDLHLLVDDPFEWIEESIAIKPARIFGQIERMGSQKMFVNSIIESDAKIGAGLALMTTTPIEALEQDILQSVSAILLLAVTAGTSGSEFDEKVVNKIKELRKIYKGVIVIDGGINKETSQLVINAGASEVASNSTYWRGEI